MDLLALMTYSSCLAPALVSATEENSDHDSDFQYDYESLRIGGLVFAVALFLLGIALIVSRKCTCSKSSPKTSTVEQGVQRG
ncbi:FXYD domain-containing ion transport regulator 6-like isoform 2-T2 [Pholidichthys leucotaenia]